MNDEIMIFTEILAVIAMLISVIVHKHFVNYMMLAGTILLLITHIRLYKKQYKK